LTNYWSLKIKTRPERPTLANASREKIGMVLKGQPQRIAQIVMAALLLGFFDGFALLSGRIQNGLINLFGILKGFFGSVDPVGFGSYNTRVGFWAGSLCLGFWFFFATSRAGD
jgi:hypothetical protein